MNGAITRQTEKKNIFQKLSRYKEYLPLYVMMLPGLAYLIVNNYIPMTGIVLAFKKYNQRLGMYASPWVGLSNFEYLFKSDAYIIIRNTLLYNVAFIIINLVVGLILAIMITDVVSKFAKKIYQSAILLPFLVSMVIMSYIVFAFLGAENGLVNNSILEPLGLPTKAWYQEPKYWPAILIFVHTWKTVGYGSLIYIAGIAGIDKSLYEAAELDGASRWQQKIHVTLPGLVPSIITLLLLNIGKIFYSDFGLFYQVTQNSGALFNVSNTIDTYVYRALLTTGGIGRSAAAGLFQSLVGFCLVLGSNLIIRRRSPENALF